MLTQIRTYPRSAMLLDAELAEEVVETIVPLLSLHVPYNWDGKFNEHVTLEMKE